MPNRKMSAEQRRAYMEQAIAAGGSVLHEGRVITSKNALPGLGDLARTEPERFAALNDIQRRREELDAEEARLRTSTGSPLETDNLADDFPGRAALSEAGITTRTQVATFSEEQLTAIPGIGPATAKKIVEARG